MPQISPMSWIIIPFFFVFFIVMFLVFVWWGYCKFYFVSANYLGFKNNLVLNLWKW
uniref:ATP synthase F0 subunit 8 n=1 Tax=Nemertopsis tetraclitophila TaxID=1417004 RepID=A0A075CJU0_9BILA|nr:ATP synthase F0 subunit 8 [Nemertopsis tetraclitophila]AGZ63906.1 ATP synthase F0 subunit 8 [Nemertopsis tetraclitophila]